MKYLTSDNFKDFIEFSSKPAFGIPTVHYSNMIQKDPENQTQHSKVLWGVIAKNLLLDQAKEGGKPRLTQLLQSNNSLNEHYQKQEFALAHNIRLNHEGEPDPGSYDCAVKRT
jgi:hypothetical protein